MKHPTLTGRYSVDPAHALTHGVQTSNKWVAPTTPSTVAAPGIRRTAGLAALGAGGNVLRHGYSKGYHDEQMASPGRLASNANSMQQLYGKDISGNDPTAEGLRKALAGAVASIKGEQAAGGMDSQRVQEHETALANIQAKIVEYNKQRAAK